MNPSNRFFTTLLMLTLLINIPIFGVDKETITAVPANVFLNSIGVNSSINARGESITKTLECAEYLGFRWIRTTGVPDGINVRLIHLQWLLQRNVKVTAFFGRGRTMTDINNFVAGARTVADIGALLAVEGPNEPNNW